MAELLKGNTVVLNNGTEVDAGDYLKGKVVALYFSAGWCSPCRAFTPKLKRFYDKLKAQQKNFEVVFVSRDREKGALRSTITIITVPGCTSSSATLRSSKELKEKYEVKTIPKLKVVKSNGDVVVQDACTEVEQKGDDAAALFEKWKAFYTA